MAKIDFQKTINDLDDKPLFSSVECLIVDENNIPKLDQDGKELYIVKETPEKVLKLSEVCEKALLYSNERVDAGKYKRWEIAKKIHKAKTPINLSAEEIIVIKALIDKYWNIIIVGRATDLLEGNE